MKAAVLSSVKKINVEDRPKPEIGLGEVLVKIQVCGICGTDSHAFQNGSLYPKGTIMGHECSGIVSEVGNDVRNVAVGDRVVINPAPPCWQCHFCKNGRNNLCVEAFERDIGSTPERGGGFATFLQIKWPESMLYQLPDSLTFEQGALVEPLATSFHAVSQSRFKQGDTAVVVGAGPIGLGVMQFLKISGAKKILVLEVVSQRINIALEAGADRVLNPIEQADELAEQIIEYTDGLGPHIVYECSGVPAAFHSALNYVRGGGQIMTIGVIEKETPISLKTVLIKEAEIRGSMCYTATEFQTVIDLLQLNKINTELMVSDVIPLEKIEEMGFMRLASSPEVIKILVKP